MPDEKSAYPAAVSTPIEPGRVLRNKRKALGMTHERAAGLTGVGIRFLSELERVKATAEIGKVLQVARRLGLEICIEPRRMKG